MASLALMSLICMAMSSWSSMTMGWASTLAVRPAMVLYCFLIAMTCRLVGVRKVLMVSAHPRVESRPSLINLKIGQMMQTKVTEMKRIVATILRTRGMVVRAEYGKGEVVLSIIPWIFLLGKRGHRCCPTC